MPALVIDRGQPVDVIVKAATGTINAGQMLYAPMPAILSGPDKATGHAGDRVTVTGPFLVTGQKAVPSVRFADQQAAKVDAEKAKPPSEVDTLTVTVPAANGQFKPDAPADVVISTASGDALTASTAFTLEQ
jgi:hypothetical protein